MLFYSVIVKATNGPRYVVGCRRQLDKARLKSGTRVALDMTTLTIMRYLPREVDPLVYNMSHEDPGDVTYSAIGKYLIVFKNNLKNYIYYFYLNAIYRWFE